MVKKVISLLTAMMIFATSAFAADVSKATIRYQNDSGSCIRIAIPIGNGAYRLESDVMPLNDGDLSDEQYDNALQVSTEDGTIYQDIQGETLLMAVNEDTLLRTSELHIDPYDLDDANQLIDQYQISEKIAEDIRAYIRNCNNGEIIPEDDLIVYLGRDLESGVGRSSNSSYNYTGYKGQLYHQELLHYSQSSKPFDIASARNGVGDYLMSVMGTVATSVADAAIEEVVGKPWKFISIFLSSDIASLVDIEKLDEAYDHEARLHENKYIKYTFVVTDYGNLLGAVTEFTDDYHFQDSLTIQGYHTYEGKNTPKQTAVAPGYYNADELAYYHYPSGYTEYISRIKYYRYNNETYNISKKVSSVIQ